MTTDEGIAEWDYRIVRYEFPEGRSRYQLSEVYFRPDGTPEWCVPHDAVEAWTGGDAPVTDPIEQLRQELVQLAEALDKPIIEGSSLRPVEEVMDALLAGMGSKG